MIRGRWALLFLAAAAWPLLAMNDGGLSIPWWLLLVGAWTAPRTWVAAAVLTASQLNTHLRDNLLLLKTIMDDAGDLEADGTSGPHSIGIGQINYTQLTLGGSFTSGGASTIANAMRIRTLLTMATGDVDARYFDVASNITTQGATETIVICAGAYFSTPDITKGSGDTITNAVNVYIAGAPDEGTNNYALFVDAGVTRLDGGVEMDGNLWLDAARATQDTGFVESASNVLGAIVGGTTVWSSSATKITAHVDLELSGNDLIVESSSERIVFNNGASDGSTISSGSTDTIAFAPGGTQILALAAGASAETASLTVPLQSGFGGILFDGGTRKVTVAPDGSSVALDATAFGNATGAGAAVHLGRNTDGSTPAAAYISMEDKGGSVQYFWPDDSAAEGVLRQSTSQPFSTNNTAGVVVGGQSSWHELKHDIAKWDGVDAVARIMGAQLYTYRFNRDSQRDDKLMHGVVIYEEDRKGWFSMNDNEDQIPAMDRAEIMGNLLGMAQVHERRIKALETKLTEG